MAIYDEHLEPKAVEQTFFNQLNDRNTKKGANRV